MKTKLLITFLLFSALALSNKSFAQRDAGGSSAGSGDYTGTVATECITQPNPISFKRNNGEGTCGDNGQIRLKFNQSPTLAPTLIGVMYEDGTPIDFITVPVVGDLTELAHKGYISYCLIGGNIDPAKKIIAVFHYEGSCQADVYLHE